MNSVYKMEWIIRFQIVVRISILKVLQFCNKAVGLVYAEVHVKIVGLIRSTTEVLIDNLLSPAGVGPGHRTGGHNAGMDQATTTEILAGPLG